MIEIDFPIAIAMRTKAKFNSEKIANEKLEQDKISLIQDINNIKYLIESEVEKGGLITDYRTSSDRFPYSSFSKNEIIKFLKEKGYKVKHFIKNNGYFCYDVFRISW